MKRTSAVSAGVLLIIVSGFASQLGAQAQRREFGSAQRVSSNLSIDQQAEQQARAFWNARITRCGDDYFTLDRSYIHQFRNLRIEVRSRLVSTSDRLNGIEYIGNTSVYVGQSRTYSPKSALYQNTGWSKWSEGFSGAMGGVGLDASLKKENGRWSVTPSSISQSGVLEPINCRDALNPEAYVRRSNEEALSAEVADFRQNSGKFGIYANNIPNEMWKALYTYGPPYKGATYSETSWVFLASNGAWGVSSRRGGIRPQLPSEAVQEISGRRVEALTTDGGYVLLGPADKFGDMGKSFTYGGIPQTLLAALNDLINNKNQWIEKVRIAPNGGWFVLYHDFSGVEGWLWENVPDGAHQAFSTLGKSYNANHRNPIRDVAFLPNGGYIIINAMNVYYSNDIPEDALNVIKMLNSKNIEMNQVFFGPNDSWIIRANGRY